MKIKSYLIIAVLFVCFFASCKTTNTKVDNKTLSVSIIPQKYFIERIAGNDFTINVLIPPGASPATYEPSPKQVKEVSHSAVYFQIGHIPFEHAWINKLLENAVNTKLVDLSVDIDLIRGKEVRHGDHIHQGGVDPHTWSSIVDVKKMLPILLNPSKKELCEANYLKFVAELDSAHEKNISRFQKSESLSFMIYHPALSYFARDYNLNQISIELDGKEPSASYMQHVISEARKKDIKLIFVQKQFSTNNANAIAKEIEGRVEAIDPLNEDWLKEMNRISDIISQLN